MNTAMARATAESTMVDTVTITDDPEGVHDDRLDQETLQLVPRTGEPETIYTGPALIHPAARRGLDGNQDGGQAIYQDLYDLRLPVDAAPKVGNVVTVDTAASDPTMEGRVFTIVEVLSASTAITRRCKLTSRTRGPRT